ncbi:SubName: Full=Uncharacterized protein {ECO:0000313/EMBL:CCA72571.1} [Serendipita indica DSM 11827]|uniref:Uncharacterized protein n=1 Tax=Serendipita indica (strain DSM 11827) TaxID=1109443 RepID=G4TMM8_SERID|nr:SubName: Full=Uncharacterized protein {ECO:0000313/EMBL:CCA72571.1} [Serendipita indica DSM 11827]CCA72571.1 hypothetical protein PIIN_06508 [Serendipita indica DSM 11827]
MAHHGDSYDFQISTNAQLLRGFRVAVSAPPPPVTVHPQRIATGFADMEWVNTQFWHLPEEDGARFRLLLTAILITHWWNQRMNHPDASTLLHQFILGHRCAFCNAPVTTLQAGIICVRNHINY